MPPRTSFSDTSAFTERAADLDARDPLAPLREEFLLPEEVRSYLDGNSLGRPTRAAAARLGSFAVDEWGARLIRGWDESWFELPLRLGDRIAALTLGAAPGQTFVGDSTTVILYKLIRAALTAQPDRDEIILDAGNFPTDRYVLEGIARDHGMTLRWIEPAPVDGVGLDDVEALLGERTALVVLSHVEYRSGHLADLPGITAAAHRHGALVLWDLCHSVGSVEIALDTCGVDLAVGCTYKYLNAGPGAPAFGYVAHRHQGGLQQPVQGWMGAADPFAMAPAYQPHPGIRRFISGTPPVTGMIAMESMLDLIEKASMPAIRQKSVALTGFATELVDVLLLPEGVRYSSPRDPAHRGSHITVDHEDFGSVLPQLWKQGVIPDFRPPHGLRLGLSPLSTSFTEVLLGVETIRRVLLDVRDAR
ncbi:kynureninase [Nesterenkonia sp. HG001]|uniref:kynureninase n=1 Tax=Nesterenkonia sp. HG001 TaxID=2983207 RepID=UPI002AC599CB|nr:kynureninase [Nesterenkonia sp. HG001]MDZ5076866.1 kynureninase [Nesterenkonia sp. HG001]